MTRIFERDLNAKVFGEYSVLSVETGDKLRLKPLTTVHDCISKEAASVYCRQTSSGIR